MASTQVTSLICNNFGGIRRKDAMFSDEKITCSDCQNVELFFTNQNSGVGIRTAKGNVASHEFEGEEVIGMYKSNQGGTDVVFVHTVDNGHGYLYKGDILTDSYEKITGITLSDKRASFGVDFQETYSDYFVFSNGESIVYLYTDNTDHSFHVTQPEHVKDTNNDDIVGFYGLLNFDSRLWLFNSKRVYYSLQGRCEDFHTSDATTVTSAGYVGLAKPITAMANYLGSIAVFHKDSSCLIKPTSTTAFQLGDESPGGCAGYHALVFHGTDLYFYDDTKKGVFAFSQVVNGDKVLTDNIALDIQDELMQIPIQSLDSINALSVVTEDRNEVWFITPINPGSGKTTILIFDYVRGEWIRRLSNNINCLLVFNSDLYSGGAKMYKEYTSERFDGEFIESYYKCSILNLGTDNTLKVTKFPPRLTIEANEGSDFWVEYVRNYNFGKKPKRKELKSKYMGGFLTYDKGMRYDSGYVYRIVNANSILKLPSTTFKALEINFKTETFGQNFCIKNIEFSKLKIKQV